MKVRITFEYIDKKHPVNMITDQMIIELVEKKLKGKFLNSGYHYPTKTRDIIYEIDENKLAEFLDFT